jgi:hypothetical protein
MSTLRTNIGAIEAGVAPPRPRHPQPEVQTPVQCATCPERALSPTGLLGWSLKIDQARGMLESAQCPTCAEAKR